MKKLIAALLLMLLALPQFAVAENAPSVTITFDKDTVAVGEEITAMYEVSGEGNYVTIGRAWFVNTDDGLGHNIGESRATELKGTCSVVPKFGEEIYLFLYVIDKDGREYQFESDKLVVTGDESKPPVVQISLNKTAIGIGEEITAGYEVSGEGNYVKIGRAWFVNTDDGLGHNIGEDRTTELKGVCSVKPNFGEEVFLFLYVIDENGREYHFESETARVIGDESKPPVVQISLNKDKIAIGEEIKAEYEVAGEGNYIQVGHAWFVNTNDGLSHNIGEDRTTQLTGSCSVIPRFGEEIHLFLYVIDEVKREYHFESKKVKVSGFADNYDIYTVIEGENTQISDGTNSLTFRADGAFEKYLGVQVDGKTVPQRYVTAWSGSTYVELSKEYLASLEEGEHELTIIFDDGVAVTNFNIRGLIEEPTEEPTEDYEEDQTEDLIGLPDEEVIDAAADLPQTGDNSALGAWAMLLAAAAVLLAQMKRAGRMNG